MKYLYQFDPSSKKFECPKCHQKRFVRYVDAKNRYLHEDFGKCDRLKCGCYRPPNKKHFALENNNIEFIPVKPKTPSYITSSVMNASLKSYETNALYIYLIKHFSKSEVIDAFKKYKLGTSKKWNGSTVFWQIDFNNKIRSGKMYQCWLVHPLKFCGNSLIRS
ncbi:MAG: hypothetical protein HRT71_12540 [Flavobacteriales bacterium]|nr:hypothetical protein [Flavobacteriales bacterium]